MSRSVFQKPYCALLEIIIRIFLGTSGKMTFHTISCTFKKITNSTKAGVYLRYFLRILKLFSYIK